jgi:regulator of PEP synthase PpsR (kinase-PPPase family)
MLNSEHGAEMASRYAKLKAMAEECRKLAAMFERDSIQSKLLEIAKHLDQWADEANRAGAD